VTRPQAPVDFAPYDRQFAADPYAVYARLRERSPIFHSSDLGMTLVARHRDIRSFLVDSRLGREAIDGTARSSHWDRLPNYSRYVRVNLLEKEGADHARLRRLVSAALDPRRVRELRVRIAGNVVELLGAVAQRGRMDFLADLAVPLPVHVIAELLGWPGDQRHRLRPWSAQIVRLYEKDHSAEDEDRAETATREFASALAELAEQRRVVPRDDLISALVAIRDQGDRLTPDELISTCMLLLNAGHEATVNAAGNGLLALLNHPEQFARLRKEPSTIPTAIEEMLRFDAPLQLFHRFVLEDFRYGEIDFAKGDTVGLLFGSGNRDPEAFERADEFDVARQPNRHLAFGVGTHFCLGAPLARLELEILFTALLRRLPGIELDGAQPEYRPGLVFRGLKELRVRWP
jgi:cytochrome P450